MNWILFWIQFIHKPISNSCYYIRFVSISYFDGNNIGPTTAKQIDKSKRKKKNGEENWFIDEKCNPLNKWLCVFVLSTIDADDKHHVYQTRGIFFHFIYLFFFLLIFVDFDMTSEYYNYVRWTWETWRNCELLSVENEIWTATFQIIVIRY